MSNRNKNNGGNSTKESNAEESAAKDFAEEAKQPEEAKQDLSAKNGPVTKNYKVPKGEEKFVHVEVEKKKFNADTGERLSKPFVQKFNVKEWPQVKKDLPGLGYNSVHVLHEPK